MRVIGYVAFRTDTNKPVRTGGYRTSSKLYTSEARAWAALGLSGERPAGIMVVPVHAEVPA